MPPLDDNLAYKETRSDQILRIENTTIGLRGYLRAGFRWLNINSLALFGTTLALFLKFILFIGLINNENAASFNYFKAFHSFSFPPPLVVYTAMIVAVLGLAFLWDGRFRYWFLVIVNLLISLVLVGDLMYYRAFSGFLSPYLIDEIANLHNLSGSIVSMLRPVDCLFIADLIVLAGIGLCFGRFHAKAKRNNYVCIFLLMISVSYVYYQHVELDFHGKGEEMLFRNSWSPNQTMSNLSPLGYHVFDIYNYFENKQTEKLTNAENKTIKNWFAQQQENLPSNHYSGLFKGQNLIIIQVESLENFVINQKVNGQPITPNLNKLLANSLYFNNFYEQVYNGTSVDADLMTNTSVYPVRVGATFFRFPNTTYNSLPKLLQKKGYSTLAIHPDKGSYWNWEPALTAIGFAKTIDAAYFKTDEKIGLGISDGSYFKQAAPIIAGEKQPFYSFMVTLTSHNPFDLPWQYRKLGLSKDLDETKLGGYFQSINYTDRQIGNFLSTLDQKRILDNSVVVIYGDHTGVHKYYNDEVEKVQPQESWWLDNSKRIPLIIYHKGLKGQLINITGGQIDTMPTLAYLMGIDRANYKDTVFGRNLLNTDKDFAVLANKRVVGKMADREEIQHAVKGIDMADLVISKNYFKAQGYQ